MDTSTRTANDQRQSNEQTQRRLAQAADQACRDLKITDERFAISVLDGWIYACVMQTSQEKDSTVKLFDHGHRLAGLPDTITIEEELKLFRAMNFMLRLKDTSVFAGFIAKLIEHLEDTHQEEIASPNGLKISPDLRLRRKKSGDLIVEKAS